MSDGEVGLVYINLEDGTYTLKEVRSPDGYVITTDTTIVIQNGEITSDNVDGKDAELIGTASVSEETGNKVYTVSIKNHPGTALPNTGGSGTLLYTLGGIGLIMASALMYIFRMRRRERRLK